MTVQDYIQMCGWDSANFLIFSDNVFGVFIYYSHLLPLIVSLILALFIYFKSPKLLETRWLLVTTLLLSFWLFSDLVLWASEKPPLIMFFWSMLVLVEPMIYAGMLFFSYAFIEGKDISFKNKLIIFGLLLPTVLLTPTQFALTEFDLSNCWREAIEGNLAYYGYLLEIVFAIWILIIGMNKFIATKDREATKVALITIGTVLFLLSFAMGNVVGSLLVDWEIGQYGLFGIPVFVAMLSYLIVKYNAFNVKLIATQILVSAIWVLTLAILFLRNIDTVRVVVYVTLVMFTVLGYLLIRSVKREVYLREQLQAANEGQANLIHIINHQIKGYLSKSRNIFSELLSDPDYNAANEKSKPMLEEGLNSLTEGVEFVRNFLDAANIEKGSYIYQMAPTDFKEIVLEAAEKQRRGAEEKGLSYEVDVKEGEYKMMGDKEQLVQAVRNLIDNSIKYTLSGGLKIHLEHRGEKALLAIKDTGVGISESLKPRLFTRGGRDKDSMKINVNSTGFGLVFVKGVAEAHKGRVWVESEGKGKGSTFYMELPVK